VKYPERQAKTIHLPVSACHASRVHAILEHTDERVRVIVVGQNGVRVRVEGKWRRYNPGESLLVDMDEQGHGLDLEIDFYGVRVRINPEHEEKPVERLFTPPPVSTQHVFPFSPASSLPPSSPPASIPDSTHEDEDEHEQEREYQLDLHDDENPSERASSPLSTTSPHLLPPIPQSREIKAELLEPLTTPSSTKDLPEGIDLPALLASTVVFSGSTKLSLPDLVKHMLEVCPIFPPLLPSSPHKK
jgi:hypothetical protein